MIKNVQNFRKCLKTGLLTGRIFLNRYTYLQLYKAKFEIHNKIIGKVKF